MWADGTAATTEVLTTPSHSRSLDPREHSVQGSSRKTDSGHLPIFSIAIASLKRLKTVGSFQLLVPP